MHERIPTFDRKTPTYLGFSTCRQLIDNFNAPAYSVSATLLRLCLLLLLRRRCLLRKDTGRSRGVALTSSPSLQLGRVDVFFATDFHGGPFREHEEGNNNYHDDRAAAVASASQSGCDVSLGSMSLGPTERGTIASGAAAGDCVVEGSEQPWFSRRVLTAG